MVSLCKTSALPLVFVVCFFLLCGCRGVARDTKRIVAFSYLQQGVSTGLTYSYRDGRLRIDGGFLDPCEVWEADDSTVAEEMAVHWKVKLERGYRLRIENAMAGISPSLAGLTGEEEAGADGSGICDEAETVFCFVTGGGRRSRVRYTASTMEYVPIERLLCAVDSVLPENYRVFSMTLRDVPATANEPATTETTEE